MLNIHCYIDPFGSKDYRKELFAVEIINDGTGDIDNGNYLIRYLENGEEIGKAEIKSYPRELGAAKLLYEAMKILLEEEV